MTTEKKPIRRYLVRIRNRYRAYGIRYFAVQALNALLYTLWLPNLVMRRLRPLFLRPLARFKALPLFLARLLPRPQGVRRYIDPQLTLESFFDELNRRSVRYVILRWFEELPKWPVGEDMDLLLQDEDLQKIRDLFLPFRGLMPVDVYTVSAKKGWQGLPYYPPHIARGILERRRVHAGRYFVPSLEDHFLSLAYHIAYRKGERSGLPQRIPEPGARCCDEPRIADHDYAGILASAAADTGIRMAPSLEEIDRLLRRRGWSPSVDTLRKLSLHSGWLRSLLPRENKDEQDGDLVVFVVREWSIENGWLGFIVEWIRERDFDLDIIKVIKLNEEQKLFASREIRGGEWGRGPYPVSGGPPAAVIVAYDYHPIPVNGRKSRTHPFIRNGHIFFKDQIRDEINYLMPRTRWVNCIHSSDDEIEAWEYLQVMLPPEEVESIRRELDRRRAAYRTRHRILHTWNSGHSRGKIEKVDLHGRPAVKKTFKAGRERFLERERLAYEYFSRKHTAVPPLLESGSNYVIIPYYENVLEGRAPRQIKAILSGKAGEIVDFMRFLYDEGYALIDFKDENLILTPEDELKVIDFEFLHRYDSRPDSFMDSFEIAGVPLHFRGDVPRDHKPARGYRWRWKHILRERDVRRRCSRENADGL